MNRMERIAKLISEALNNMGCVAQVSIRRRNAASDHVVVRINIATTEKLYLITDWTARNASPEHEIAKDIIRHFADKALEQAMKPSGPSFKINTITGRLVLDDDLMTEFTKELFIDMGDTMMNEGIAALKGKGNPKPTNDAGPPPRSTPVAYDHDNQALSKGDLVRCLYRGGYTDQIVGEQKVIKEISCGQIRFDDNVYREAHHWKKVPRGPEDVKDKCYADQIVGEQKVIELIDRLRVAYHDKCYARISAGGMSTIYGPHENVQESIKFAISCISDGHDGEWTVYSMKDPHVILWSNL